MKKYKKSRLARLALASLIVPLVPVLAFVLPSLLGRESRMAGWYLFGGLPISYAVMISFGIPVYFLLSSLEIRSIFSYFLAGLIAGCVVFLLPFYPILLDPSEEALHSLAAAAIFIPMLMLIGALTGSLFWIFARPDLP